MISALLALVLLPQLTVRRAVTEISPPEPLPLGGYTERHGKVMDKGGDPLFARCVLLQQGSLKIAIVSAEMLTIPESLFREVSSRIPSDVCLFLQATHTHSAPDSQMLNERMTFAIPGIATYRKRWLSWYSDRLASCIKDSLVASPVSADVLTAVTTSVNANRARRKGGIPDPRRVEIRLASTGPTPFSKGESSLLFSFYTAHPIIFDETRNQASGDWIGELARRTGAPVLNGAIGDVSPKVEGSTAEARMQSFFTKLDEKKKATSSTIFKSGDRLQWTEQPIKLLPMRPHPSFAIQNGIPEALAQNLVSRFAPPQASIRVIRLGKLAIVGIPGEPTSILDRAIQSSGRKMGFPSVLVCSHVNGWMGYILDAADYDRGGYEATLSFYGRDEGALVVDAASKALAAMKARKNSSL